MAKIDNELVDKMKLMIGEDDSILVDGSALMVEGSIEFFKNLITVMPKFKDKTLIIPIEGVNAVNKALQGRFKAKKAMASDVIKEWLQDAIIYSQKPKSNLIFVGESTGAFSEKTVLNQVSFLCGDKNVLLITQDQKMTIQARKLREKLKLKDKKLHCCKIMPDGRLGLYRFANDEKNE